MSVQQDKLKAIADKIREKTGTTDLIVPNEFAGKIDVVYQAGKTEVYEDVSLIGITTCTDSSATISDKELSAMNGTFTVDFQGYADIEIRANTENGGFTLYVDGVEKLSHSSLDVEETVHSWSGIVTENITIEVVFTTVTFTRFNHIKDTAVITGTYNQGTKDGRKSEYDEFWDMFQDNGNRPRYTSAFINWSAEYIRPKHKVIPTQSQGITQMFDACINLKKVEAGYFDLSQKPQELTSTNNNFGYYYTFNGCSKLEEIEDIGMIAQNNYNYAFSYCYALHTIAKMGVDVNTRFSNTFHSCRELVNLTINGTIGQNGFNVQWSTKLSATSLESIINALSTSTTGLTITLPTTAQANYEAVYGTGSWATLTATKSNWTIAYA